MLLQSRSIAVAAVLMLICLILPLSGCGGGGRAETTGAPDAAAGSAAFTVRWPEASRLIPFASNSIRVRLTRGELLLGERLLVRPAGGGETSALFERLSAGDATATATAYPNADGTGVSQAQAQVAFTIVGGQTTPLHLTLGSTIDRVEVTAANPSVPVGQSIQLAAAAKNAAGEAVLIASEKLLWRSLNGSAATVDGAGKVTGVAAGTAVIEVTETESGKTGSITITIAPRIGGTTGEGYVGGFVSHDVSVYDAASGNFLKKFVSHRTGGLEETHAVLFGPDNIVYVSSDSRGVLRFRADTGAFIDTFVPNGRGGLDNACGILIGKDGNLLVCSAWTSQVKRYNITTGAFIDNFISGNGMNIAHDVIFGPDGKLYVASNRSHEVKRFDPDTGAFLGNFVTSGSGGLNQAGSLVFGPDGNLYVSSFVSHEVKRYNGATGAFMDNFVTARSGGLDGPVGVSFGPDGHLYVASANTSRIKRYHGTTGAYLGDLDPDNRAGLDRPWGITFR